MALMSYIQRRRSGVYEFRKRLPQKLAGRDVPAHVRDRFPDLINSGTGKFKREFVRSLDTKDAPAASLSGLIDRWSPKLKDGFEKAMRKKNLPPYAIDPKRYPIKLVRQKVLGRHPLLGRWGGEINGRVLDWGDLMFVESEVIISTMLILKRDHGIPSLPVHDSLIVLVSKVWRTQEVLRGQFQRVTSRIARLKTTPESALDKAVLAEALNL